MEDRHVPSLHSFIGVHTLSFRRWYLLPIVMTKTGWHTYEYAVHPNTTT